MCACSCGGPGHASLRALVVVRVGAAVLMDSDHGIRTCLRCWCLEWEGVGGLLLPCGRGCCVAGLVRSGTFLLMRIHIMRPGGVPALLRLDATSPYSSAPCRFRCSGQDLQTADMLPSALVSDNRGCARNVPGAANGAVHLSVSMLDQLCFLCWMCTPGYQSIVLSPGQSFTG